MQKLGFLDQSYGPVRIPEIGRQAVKIKGKLILETSTD